MTDIINDNDTDSGHYVKDPSLRTILDLSEIMGVAAGKYMNSPYMAHTIQDGSADMIVIRAGFRVILAALSHYPIDARPGVLGSILLELTELVIELQRMTPAEVAEEMKNSDSSQQQLNNNSVN